VIEGPFRRIAVAYPGANADRYGRKVAVSEGCVFSLEHKHDMIND
jgi:hypothetical protein